MGVFRRNSPETCPRSYMDVTQFHISSKRKRTQNTTRVIKRFGRSHKNQVSVGGRMMDSLVSLSLGRNSFSEIIF